MDCHEFKPLVVDYLDGNLDAEQLNSFAQHMIDCAHCEEYILGLADAASDSFTDEKGGQSNVL